MQRVTIAHRSIGAVLVGGQSRRMGRDKALLSWGGAPLATVVASRVAAVTPQVVLVGGAARGLGYPRLDDDSTLPGRGPMVGLASILRAMRAPVLLVACDMPELAPGILRRLVRLAGDAVAAAPVVDGRLEPLCGFYRPAIVPVALASLSRGSGRMADLFQVPGSRRIEGAALGELASVRACLRNLNRPHDLRAVPSPAIDS